MLLKGLPLALFRAHDTLRIRTYETPEIQSSPEQVQVFPETSRDLLQDIHENALPCSKLQRILTREVENITHAHHLTTLTAADRKRTRSLSSSAAVSVHQTHPVLTPPLPSKVMISTAKLRTNTLKLPVSECACGRPLTVPHSFSCKKMRGRIIRHDVLVQLFHECGAVARKEVLILPGSSKRMDIVVYLPTGEQIWVDITIANPEAPTYLNQPRAATEIRENAKKSKYLKHATERGITFLPAAIDTYGATGEGMETLLQFLARSAYETHPWPYTADEDAWTG